MDADQMSMQHSVYFQLNSNLNQSSSIHVYGCTKQILKPDLKFMPNYEKLYGAWYLQETNHQVN
jgi:hypothetical protein